MENKAFNFNLNVDWELINQESVKELLLTGGLALVAVWLARQFCGILEVCRPSEQQ
jgi:hypothetical protein